MADSRTAGLTEEQLAGMTAQQILQQGAARAGGQIAPPAFEPEFRSDGSGGPPTSLDVVQITQPQNETPANLSAPAPAAPAADPRDALFRAALEAQIGAQFRQQGSNARLFAQGPSRPGGVLVGGVPSDRGPGMRDFVPLDPDTQRGVSALEREQQEQQIGQLSPAQISQLVLNGMGGLLGGGAPAPAAEGGATEQAVASAETTSQQVQPGAAGQLLQDAASQQAQGPSPMGETPFGTSLPSQVSPAAPPEVQRLVEQLQLRSGPQRASAEAPRMRDTEGGSGVMMRLRRAREQAAVPTSSLIEQAMGRRGL